MDILDDLDILGDLPDGFDISVDEILAEYATPGLFSAPLPKYEEIPGEEVPEIVVDESAELEPAPAADAAEEVLINEDSYQLGDILFDFGTPVDEDGVKVYSPKAKVQPQPDGVPLISAETDVVGETLPFAAVTGSEAKQAAPEKKKRMSWRERRAAKKAAKAEAKARAKAAPEQPASREEALAAYQAAAEVFAEAEAAAEPLLSEELDAELIAAQLAEEEARRAALEAEMEARAEAELFAWLDATSAYRTEEENAVPEPVVPVQPEAQPEPLPVLQTAESDVPRPELALDTEEAGDTAALLENPDIEPEAAPEREETPEEAAARKAKADDDLHYTPEAPTAKAVASGIGKRLAALFMGFAESGEAGVDVREEELGPELAPGKAARFFSKYVKGYRFRLRIAAVLCVVLCWISLGLPVFGSLKNPAVAAAACLMLLLTVMLAGADILAAGVLSLLQRKPGAHALVALSCLASVIDAVAIIVCKGAGGYLPFCAVSAVSMCFAIYGSLLYCRGQRLNFRVLEQSAEPMTISVDYGIVDPETTTVYRTPGHPEGYIHRSEEEDLSETVHNAAAPLLIAAVPVLALIAAVGSKQLGNYFHIMAAMFAATASFSALVAFPLPYFLVERDLFRGKATIAGWAGARDLGKVSTMVVTDRDLFPDETVSIQSVRIVDHVPPQLTLSYMCSLVNASGSCLVPAFRQLAENNDCDILPVENFRCHEAGGLSCDIGPDRVLVASHSYMKLQGFRIPARKKDSENALFLAVNDHVIAYVIVEYKAVKSVRAGLDSALRGSAEMVFAARDFNITPLLISKKFKSPTDTLRFPSYSQRYEITDRADSDTAACAAVVARKSFYPYAVVVERARNLYRAVSLTVALSAVSTLIGILLVFIMTLTGAAAVTVSRLLIYMLLWLIPTLALSIGITQ